MNDQNRDILIDYLHPDMAKKIIRDFKLPFSYINPVQFASMVDCMSEVAPEFNDAINMMVDICSRIKKEDQPQFCGFIHDVTDAMVDHIIHNTGYQAFNQRDINMFFPMEQQNIPTGDNYNYENIGKDFISIDLKNAAFQAMKTWDYIYGKAQGYLIGDLINDYETFVSYVAINSGFCVNHNESVNHMVISYISTCKSLRQVIFGKTNPKRIMHIEKFIMQAVVKLVEATFNITPIRFNNDEVVYEYNVNLKQSLLVDDTLSHIDIIVTSLATNQSTKFHIPMDFHKNIYNLDGYSLIQCDDLVQAEYKKPIKFYVKNKISISNDTKTKLIPDFKNLPSNVYLIARALFNKRPVLAKFLETQPILIDGVFHWLALRDTQINMWELQHPHVGIKHDLSE